jgi:hypothetical protein
MLTNGGVQPQAQRFGYNDLLGAIAFAPSLDLKTLLPYRSHLPVGRVAGHFAPAIV